MVGVATDTELQRIADAGRESPSDLVEYRAFLRKCREDNRTTVITHAGPKYFALMMAELLHAASSTVTIFSDRLTRFASNGDKLWADQEICDGARALLKKPGSAIRFLVRYRLDADPTVGIPDHHLLHCLITLADRQGKVGVAIANAPEPNIDGVNDYQLYDHNFAVVDDRAYRLELDGGDRDAIAAFNGSDAAIAFARVFDDMVAQLRRKARTLTDEGKPYPRAFNFSPGETTEKYNELRDQARLTKFLRKVSAAPVQEEGSPDNSSPLTLLAD